MAKISKNIKKLRAEKGFTQELLAEKLFISRQAVSSWENDRTQPDVEMLEKLSEVFGVSIEELIYGKKRNTTLELEKTNYNNTLTIVFSILGALLVGIGLILIFVTFWKDMTLLSKGLLSFLPLVAGQGAGIFVLCRKKEKVAWCEGGSVLWTAGVVVTLCLIQNIFDISIYTEDIMLLIGLTVFPVILFLRSVAPLAVYYGCVIFWGFEKAGSLTAVLITAALVAAGCVVSAYLLKAEDKSHRSLFAHWLSVIAVTVFVTMLGMGIDNLTLGIVGLITVFICLYLISLKHTDLSLPYRIPGLLGTALTMLFVSWIFFDNLEIDGYSITYTAVCLAGIIISATAVKLRGKDNFSVAYIGTVFIFLIIYTVSLYIMGDRFDSEKAELMLAALKIPAIAGYIIMMISGAREKKLIPINTGFLGVSATTMIVVAYSELSMMTNGIILLLFGGLLLLINFRISKAKQKVPTEENSQEVQNCEK